MTVGLEIQKIKAASWWFSAEHFQKRLWILLGFPRISIPGTGLYNRQYLGSTPQNPGTTQQGSGIGCCGCLGSAVITFLTLAIVATIFANGNTTSLVVLCLIAVAVYVAWRRFRGQNYATSPIPAPPPDFEPLGHEVRVLMEQLREPIKNELRKMHGASSYDEVFTLELIELICRFAALDGTIDDSEGKVFLDIFKVLHPKTYAGLTATDGACLLNGHLQRHPDFLQSPIDQITLLKLAKQAGITAWMPLKDLLCKIALRVAMADGPLSDREKVELESLRNIAPPETAVPVSAATSEAAPEIQPQFGGEPTITLRDPPIQQPLPPDTTGLRTSTATLDSLKQAAKDLLEGLEELLKVELRKIRQSGMARDLLEQNIREVIIRFGTLNGQVSPSAASLYLEMFRTLHPRSFGSWTEDNALGLLRGIVEKDRSTYYGAPKKPFTLGLIEQFDSAHGTNFAKSFRDLLLAIAVFAAADGGTVSDEKANEITNFKALLESTA